MTPSPNGSAGKAAIRHVAVLVPARNEEMLLPRCLASVQQACLRLPLLLTSEVVVVCDSSSDHTAKIARQLLGRNGTVLCTDAGNVGIARAIAAVEVLRRFAGEPDECWIANTDADCHVPPTWLTDQLELAAQGVDAVTGIVDVEDFSEHLPHVRDRFRATYRIGEDGTHPHVHGANLGIRADAYLDSGGWGGLETAEDHDLWRRLRASGARCVSDAALVVVTSGRRVGRAPAGFAAALAAHNECAV